MCIYIYIYIYRKHTVYPYAAIRKASCFSGFLGQNHHRIQSEYWFSPSIEGINWAWQFISTHHQTITSPLAIKKTPFPGSNLIMVTHFCSKWWLEASENLRFFLHQPFGCIKSTVNSDNYSQEKPTELPLSRPKIVAPSRHPNSIPLPTNFHTSSGRMKAVCPSNGDLQTPRGEKGPEISRQNWWLFRGKNGEQRQQNPDMTFAWNTEGSYSDPHNGCHSIPHVTACWPLEIPYTQQITRGFGHCSAISLRFFGWRNLPPWFAFCCPTFIPLFLWDSHTGLERFPIWAA